MTFPYEVEFPDGVRYRQAELAGGNRVFARHLNDYELWFLKVTHHGQYYEPNKDWWWRNSLPMVYQVDGGTATPITDAIQYHIMALNPNATPKQIRMGLNYYRAFTNGLGKGFDTRSFLMLFANKVMSSFLPKSVMLAVGGDYVPLRDLFNGKDMNAPHPKEDKVRVVGNDTYRGVFSTDGDWFYPEYINPDIEVPVWNDFKDMWWLHRTALNIHKNIASGMPRFSDFNQGNGYPFKLPFIARPLPDQKIRLPARAMQVVTQEADQYTTYIGV